MNKRQVGLFVVIIFNRKDESKIEGSKLSTLINESDSRHIVHTKINNFVNLYIELTARLLFNQGRYTSMSNARRSIRKLIAQIANRHG